MRGAVTQFAVAATNRSADEMSASVEMSDKNTVCDVLSLASNQQQHSLKL